MGAAQCCDSAIPTRGHSHRSLPLPPLPLAACALQFTDNRASTCQTCLTSIFLGCTTPHTRTDGTQPPPCHPQGSKTVRNALSVELSSGLWLRNDLSGDCVVVSLVVTDSVEVSAPSVNTTCSHTALVHGGVKVLAPRPNFGTIPPHRYSTGVPHHHQMRPPGPGFGCPVEIMIMPHRSRSTRCSKRTPRGGARRSTLQDVATIQVRTPCPLDAAHSG